jgi:CRP-like cAMP-binding protein
MEDALTFGPAGRTATRPRLTTLQRAELLGQIPVFSEMSVEDLYRLASLAQEVAFAAGQTVYRKNDVGDALYLVVEGRIAWGTEDDKAEWTAGPREAVGLYSVLTREPRPGSARAVEDTFALAVGAEDLLSLLACNTEMIVGLMKYFVKKLGGMPQT